jgi:pimeloyl-ACP methyl ester carboxylesterase
MNSVDSFVEINRCQLEMRRIPASPAGSGLAPLVFLHEGLGSVALWTQRGFDWPAAVCAATGRAGRVFSRAGYGRSEPSPLIRPDPAVRQGRPDGRLPPDYMQQEAWNTLPALLAELGISRPVLVGHSDGATIALLYASRHPATACVAMAPHVMVEPVAVEAIAEAKEAFETGGLRERLARYHSDVDGAFWQWNDVWLSEAFRGFDIRSDCRQIAAPLLLIQGEGDEYGSMLQLVEITLAVPGATELRLEACGHSPQRDQPEKTVAAISAFLADLG